MATQSTSNLRNWSTPLTIGAYLVTGVSGVLLFFHIGEGLIKEAHEWIGLAFVLGALLHVVSNRVPFKRYFANTLSVAVIAAVLVVGTAMVAASGTEPRGNPTRAVMTSVEKAPLSLVAKLQGRAEEELVQLLEQAGINVTDPEESVQTIAAVNNKSVRELMPLLFRSEMEERR